MSLTTLDAILADARATIAAIPTSRDATQNFLEHETNVPFETSPLAGRDGFEVVARAMKQAQGFGISGAREWEADLVVKLGHAPFSTDDQREDWMAEDVERLTDLLESHTWPTGTMLVLSRQVATDKADPNWWVTEITFTLVWIGALRTS